MPVELNGLAVQFRVFQLVYVALRLQLLKHLASGIKTVDELAAQTNVPAARLLRIVRGLIWAGVLAPHGPGFTLTSEGQKLIDQETGSIASDILYQGRFFYASWGRLYDYATTGQNPFRDAHGTDLFQWLSEDAAVASEFVRPMSLRTTEYADAIAALPIFAAAKRFVDVGGGDGELGIRLLRIHERLEGAVFDLAVMQPAAETLIAKHQLNHRYRFVAGDMFKAIPSGADVYILKWVLHDWCDEACRAILRSLRTIMTPCARLVIVERPMPEDLGASASLAQADLNMLCLNGGAERTVTNYAGLCASCGFDLESTTPVDTRYGFSALLVRPI